MVTNKGSRRRNILALIVGMLLCLILQKVDLPSLFHSNLHDNNLQIYCINKKLSYSVGAIIELNNNYYECKEVGIWDNDIASNRKLVAWVKQDNDENN